MSSVVSHNFDDYESLLVTLQNVLGIVVTDEQRGSLLKRVESLLSSNNLESIAELTKSLNGNNELKATLLETLSLHHHDWNLPGEIKKSLHDYIFSQLPEKAKICIVGCGQGQLAYSIAMEIAEYENQNAVEKNFQIFATDSLSSNLKTAEAGVYTQQQLDPLCAEYRKRYVVAGDVAGKFKIKNKIRHTVNFLQYNLAADLVSDTKLPDEIDLIVCPEALVYFTSSDKEKITLQLSKMLKSGGVFLTGGSQLLLPQAVMSESCSLERVNHSSGDFYRRIN
jgi:chemotaxis methyl-accepting protein methylase